MDMLQKAFGLETLGTTAWREIRAGCVTFLSLSYILAVNPQILADAGLPARDVATATALASALACLVMGIYARYPFALAPGMGLNAYFTYGVVIGLGVEWQVALGAVFVEGVIFLGLTVTGARSALMRVIPLPIKIATMCGIGLLLGIIGLHSARIVVAHPATLVTVGDLHNSGVLLSLAGIGVIGGLVTRRFPGAILIGISLLTGLAWATGIARPPLEIVSWPRLPAETFLAFDLTALWSTKLALVVVAFLFVDLFDTAGTLSGLGRLAGAMGDDGELPRADRAFAADAVGTVAGAVLGTSPVTSFVESATGIEDGGRSGLTAVTVGVLFVLSLFFVPLAVSVPTVATAPALVVVGAFMMRGARDLDWSRTDEAIPAFLTMAVMPFTYSIANGISVGIISWVWLRIVSGRQREVHPALFILCVLVVLFHAAVLDR